MKRSKNILLVIVLTGLLGIAIIGIAAADSSERPFKAASDEYVVDEGVYDGSRCPFVEVNSEGSGNAAHLGNFTVVRQHCFTLPDHPEFPGSVMHDGIYEITAANGDKIWGTYSGELQPTEFGDEGPIRGIITSPSTIDGGTGRFEGAQGEYLATGDYDLVADTGVFEMEGWISY